jgi:lipoate-protein ligase A
VTTDRQAFRLLLDGAASGAWNMAVDEALMRAGDAGFGHPTIRFYTWQPATVSIGAAQPLAGVDRAGITVRGWGLVRRMTGGRGIVHADELTYSVTAPIDIQPLAGGIMPSYRTLSRGLVRGLESLGVTVEVERRSGRDTASGSANCFVSTSTYEVTVAGRKLLGSAQTRAGGWLLQHGSLLRSFTEADWTAAFPDSGGTRLTELVASLDQVLPLVPSNDTIARALADGLAAELGVALQPGTLSDEERGLAEHLMTDRYLAEEWTTRR